MMRKRCTLWHGLRTKEACTSRGAQAHKVPFCPFRVLNRYHVWWPVPQGSCFARLVFHSTTSWSAEFHEVAVSI